MTREGLTTTRFGAKLRAISTGYPNYHECESPGLRRAIVKERWVQMIPMARSAPAASFLYGQTWKRTS